MGGQSALKSDRLCKSLTGLTAVEFTQLVESFRINLLEARIKAGSDRLRAFGGGRTGNLVTVENKLFFSLMYLKCYPTYDVLGWIVDFHNYHPNTLIPVKKLRKSKYNPNPPPLTQQQKESNRLISSFRVIAEHAISGVKRYICLQQPFRNRIKQLDDTFILLSTGLWNYHLQLKS